MSESVDNQTTEPPQSLPGIVRYAGPGLIVAGSIVGSVELIATTKTGAQAGYSLLWLVWYWVIGEPAKRVLLSGVAQSVMLAILAPAALYFRYHRCVDGLTPGTWWDAFQWISAGLMVVTGAWTIDAKFMSYFAA